MTVDQTVKEPLKTIPRPAAGPSLIFDSLPFSPRSGQRCPQAIHDRIGQIVITERQIMSVALYLMLTAAMFAVLCLTLKLGS